MKKLLSVLFSTLQREVRGGLLFLTLLTSISLWAYDYDFEHNEIRYKIISDEVGNRTVEVVGSYTNYATHFTIPQTVIHGAAAYEVIRIGDEAFDNHKTIAVIELPNSITSIGKSAFYNSTLKEIVIPNSVTDIEESAFQSCTKLTSVTIGDGVMSIGSAAFGNCSSLTSITIPNSVTSIGDYAFCECSSLTSITIPNSVKTAGYWAFGYCSSLKSVIWDAKNTVSAYESFEDSPIATITFTDNVETIPSGICYNMSSLTSVSIGNSVMRIEGSAFYGCKFLASITLPNSLTSIESKAFCNCPSLSSITIPKSVTNLEFDAFYMCYFAADNFVNYSSQQSFGGAIIVDADINGLLITDSTLVKCRPNVVSAEVPEGVKSIESSAFKESPLLTTITIGNDVKTIGANAFENCGALTSVVITDSVQTINDKAFLNCTSLSSVSISDATTYIGKDAFAGTAWFDNKPDGVVYINNVLYKYKGTMPANTSVTIKDGTLFISPSAFKDCSSLSSVKIPNGVLGIGYTAFYGCSSLTEITIPYSVLLVQSQAFDYCHSLSSVKWNAKGIPNVPPEYTGGGMPSLGDGWIVGGVNYTNIFNKGSYVTSFVFGDSVEHIPAHLCQEMEGLRSVTLPKSVATIGEKAFFSCLSLTEITIPENVTYVAHFAFANCPSLTSVTWNAKKCRDFYHKIANATGGTPNDYPFYNGYITSLTFGDSVEYIPAFLCYKMDSITTINIPNSVDSIGEYAFFGCSSLTKTNYTGDIAGWCNIKFGSSSANPMYCSHNFYINDQEIKDLVIPNSVDSIHDYAFYNCSSLTSVTIPNSVTSIGYAAFRDCSSLTSVTIGESVTSIGDYAFAYCTSLTSVTIPNSLTSIGDHAFYDCTSLASVVWNAINYTSDASSVFEGDVPSQITSFVFGDSVKCIPSYLCGGMSALTSITIPNSVINIGDNAFYGCSSLTSITIPNSVTSMGEYAFRNCKSLSSVVIGNSVTKIRTETFKDCSSLTSVTIGKKVKEIGTDAFDGCSALAQTNYTGDIAGWCKIAFGSFSSNPTYYSKNLFINGEEVKDVVIPNTVTSISSCAFYNCVGISSVTIPESVKSIGYNAFGGCKKLFDIYCYPTTPPEAQENSFTNYNVNLYVPCESLKDYQMDMVFGSFKYIQCLEDLIPSEPQDTTITHTAEMVTICEGEAYKWHGYEYSQSGTYTYTETEETEEYIYHNVYTLELTVLPSETIEYVIEAEDSYEWHGVVHTESGTYTYRYECTTEILYLTIKDTPDTPDNPIIDTVITGLQYADAYFIADAEYGDYWVFDLYQDYDAYDYVYPAVYVMVNEAYSKNSLNGTYNVLYTEYYTDAESMISTDDEAEDFVGTLTIKHVKGTNYSFNGSFVVDGITYTYDQIVSVFAYEYSAEEETYYELTLSEIDSPDTPDTPERVLSCEEAVALCLETGATATTEEYTIRGYVTEITTEYSELYNNISFYMADTKDGGQVLFTYRIKPMFETDCAVKVGDFVEAVGTLVNYNGNLPEVYPGVYTIVAEPESPMGTSNILSPTSNTQKVVKDGQLLIIHEGKTYNAQGAIIN